MNSPRALLVALAAALLALGGCLSNHGDAASAEPRTSVDATSNPWFPAATSGEAGLNAAAASGADINAHERRDKYTPLHMAAIAGNQAGVRFLLAHGAQVDARTAAKASGKAKKG